MNGDLEPIYICIYEGLEKKFGIGMPVDKKKILDFLGRTYHIKKRFREVTIIKLLNLGLIEKTNGINVGPGNRKFFSVVKV